MFWLGLAYGVLTSVKNLGLAFFPIVIAAIYNFSDSTYLPNVEYLFIFLAFVGMIIGIYLNYNDYYYDKKILNSSTSISTSSSSVRTHQIRIDSDNSNDLKSMKSRLIVRVFDDSSVTDVEALLVSDCHQ